MTTPDPTWLAGHDLPVTADTLGPLLRAASAAGALDLPLPGAGQTEERWRALTELSALDLVLGRLAEAHADALAVLAELGGAPRDSAHLWGVWAAESSAVRLEATPYEGGWRLTGRKGWCSGVLVLDRALVTADADDGRRLFAVDVTGALAAGHPVAPGTEQGADRPDGRGSGAVVVPDSWRAVGMAASGSYALDLHAVPAVAVGGPGAYLDRPGFWHGGAGVAACWFGGALGAARALLEAVQAGRDDPHTLAHLGAVDAIVVGLQAHLTVAAAQVDDTARPGGTGTEAARLLATRLRARVEAGATEVLDRVGRALGAGPLCLDPVQAQRAADLPVYLRQSHAERDLAGLGELAASRADW